jgi:uncharacterized membrane protein
LNSDVSSSGASLRFDSIDALRGFAMVWMTVFHFCFDLNNFGHIQQNFYTDPIWTWQRTCILSLFLFTAGFSQAVAVSQGQCWPRFWRRWSQIAVCALLVTAGSYWMFPKTFIYFGVLHGMLVMLMVVRFTAGWGRWLWPLGAVTVAAGWVAGFVVLPSAMADLLNARSLNWIGWVTHKPHTEDYVPLIPWLGVMWWGAAAGAWAMRSKVQWLRSPKRSRSPVGKGLTKLGQWSLSYYMIHQPILIGGLMGFAWFTRS